LVFKPDTITERLKELDTIIEELSLHKEVTVEDLKASLSKRWIIERGLIAASKGKPRTYS
jgi:lambda repressor-like predicted transcriptional regulator